MRDNHEKKQDCKWFKNGNCRFPENECWNKHEERFQEPSVCEEIKCHTCRKTFTSKDEMMTHRLKDYPEKVKHCKDGENCTQQKCWYKHDNTKEKSKGATPENESGDDWVNSELDSESMDFQQAPKPPTPPTKSAEGLQNTN